MTIASHQSDESLNVMTVKDILDHIKSAWKLLAILSFAGAFIGLSLGLLTRNTYEATAIVRPINSIESPNVLQNLGSQLGGLGELAGFSDKASDDTNYKLALLRSRMFGDLFILRYHLQEALTQHLSTTWLAVPGTRLTPWRLYRVFDRNVRDIEFDKKTGLITVKFSWDDPQTAAAWANAYVAMANEEARQRQLLVTTNMLADLRKEAARNNLNFLDEAITRISERQMQTLILVHSKSDFAFEVIDPAQPPDEKASPARVLWTLIGALSGLLIGLTATLVRLALRNSVN